MGGSQMHSHSKFEYRAMVVDIIATVETLDRVK